VTNLAAMSDESNPHGTPTPAPPQGDDGSWTPPPPSATPPPAPTPPVPGQPPGPGGPTGDATSVSTGPEIVLSPGLVFGLVAVVAIVLGLLLKESEGAGAPSVNLWDRTSAPLWSIVAIVAAVATLLPALRSVVKVAAWLAWLIAAAGAGYLVFWWVLFVLPSISLNVAFLATLGVAAAVAAVWTSPDNPYRDENRAS
jgi:hypothetical protein